MISNINFHENPSGVIRIV